MRDIPIGTSVKADVSARRPGTHDPDHIHGTVRETGIQDVDGFETWLDKNADKPCSWTPHNPVTEHKSRGVVTVAAGRHILIEAEDGTYHSIPESRIEPTSEGVRS